MAERKSERTRSDRRNQAAPGGTRNPGDVPAAPLGATAGVLAGLDGGGFMAEAAALGDATGSLADAAGTISGANAATSGEPIGGAEAESGTTRDKGEPRGAGGDTRA